ncbi:hypothetical protein PG993_003179 [Apiospora rasikravindrae]|uniref:2TM domain-containing protein n=1 Tax=Apiospora rasikravindrae TaxID=990691 RepID=A0ABR1TYS8_9PEZI
MTNVIRDDMATIFNDEDSISTLVNDLYFQILISTVTIVYIFLLEKAPPWDFFWGFMFASLVNMLHLWYANWVSVKNRQRREGLYDQATELRDRNNNPA